MFLYSFFIYVFGLVFIAFIILDIDFCMYNNCIVGNNNNNSLCNVKRYEYCKKMYFSIGVKWLRLFYDVV